MGSLDVKILDGATPITLKNTQWAYDLSREIKPKGWFGNSDAEEGGTAMDSKKAIATWTLTCKYTSLSSWKTARDNILTAHLSANTMKLQIGSTPTVNVKVFLARLSARSTEATGGDNIIEMNIVLIEGEAFKLFS